MDGNGEGGRFFKMVVEGRVAARWRALDESFRRHIFSEFCDQWLGRYGGQSNFGRSRDFFNFWAPYAFY